MSGFNRMNGGKEDEKKKDAKPGDEDDPCKKDAKSPDCIGKKVADNIPDWQQLLIMTSSNHYIIGNSTFSWFGAYLSSSVNPVICYPNTWLGPNYAGTITDDLFPDSWIKIGNANGSIITDP